MRYQFYREHKYVSFALSELERLIAKTDFCNATQTEHVKAELNFLTLMLRGHAQYENEKLHGLLREKGSHIHEHVECDHMSQDEQLNELEAKLNEIIKVESQIEKTTLGYQFYLAYRKFVGDNLAHLHEEETVLLPELQKLYSDDELRMVEFDTYERMTPEQMAHMMDVLFPHMNTSDRQAFLKDMQDFQPEKLAQARLLMHCEC